jgi:hypothetical protein
MSFFAQSRTACGFQLAGEFFGDHRLFKLTGAEQAENRKTAQSCSICQNNLPQVPDSLSSGF